MDKLKNTLKQYTWVRAIYYKLKPIRFFIKKWRNTLFVTPCFILWPWYVMKYFAGWIRYSNLPGSEKLSLINSYPCLYDKTSVTGIDKHYFYQGLWAMKNICNIKPDKHVDVGSDNKWVGWLATQIPVVSIDIRPLPVEVDGLECRNGSILSLPFNDDSVKSISCLHVVEHVGLGRYGDPFDVKGTEKACQELTRVLAIGGLLYISLPIGKPRVCFNAHRISDPGSVIEYCEGLTLEEFSVIDDDGIFIENTNPLNYGDSYYACGLYIFKKN